MASSNGGDEMTDKRDVKSKIAMFKCLEKPTVPPKPVRPPTIKRRITKTEPNIEGTSQRPKEESVETTKSERIKDHKVSTRGGNVPNILPTVDKGNQASNAVRRDKSDIPLSNTELSEEQKRLQATLNTELREKSKGTLRKSYSEGNKDHKVCTSGGNVPDVLPTVDAGNQASNTFRKDESEIPFSNTKLSEEQKSGGNTDHKVSTSDGNGPELLPTVDTDNQSSNAVRKDESDETFSKTELSEEQKRLQATLNIELCEKTKETLPKSDRKWSPNELEVFNKPMCLISTDDSENILKIEKDTLAQISRIDWPLCVVSVAGLYRTGKSYLMNRLAGKTEGFALGDTIESKTKGIWVWCRIHPNVEKKNTVLVLLDTEGLGDIEKGDPNHDNKIFTIAVLLCNTLVYNMKGAFDQDAVAKLTFVTEMSQNIRFGDENSDENDKLKLVLPSFVLCLRDFSLKLYKTNKGSITEDDYLEDCLQSSEKKGAWFNKPRECIRKFFPDRKCFTMPVPGDGDTLENLENLQFDALSPKFKAAAETFVENIYTRDAKELLVSKPINGAMFATLAENYINALANGAIPDVDDAFTAVAKLENARVQATALELFRTKMESINLPVPSKRLEDLYTEAQRVALHYFRENAVHDFIDRTFEKETEMVMKSTWNEVLTKNASLIRSKCQETLQCKGEEFRGNIKSEKYYVAGGYGKYKEDLEKFRQTYMSELKGYDEHEVLMSWMKFQQNMAETDNKILQKDTKISEEEKETQRLQNDKQMKKMQENHKHQLDAKLAEQKKEQEEREKENKMKREQQLQAEREKFNVFERNMMAQQKQMQSELDSTTKQKAQIQTQIRDMQQSAETERRNTVAKENKAKAKEKKLMKKVGSLQKEVKTQNQLSQRVNALEADQRRIKGMDVWDRFCAVFTGY